MGEKKRVEKRRSGIVEEEIGEKYDRKKVDEARKKKKNMNKMVKKEEKKDM